MKSLLIGTILGLGSTALLATPALAASPGTQGQPNQSCQTVFGTTDASLFFPTGFGTNGFNNTATQVYAGAQSVNSGNPASVSQYDVACFQNSSR